MPECDALIAFMIAVTEYEQQIEAAPPIGWLWLHDDVYVGSASTNGLSSRAGEIRRSKYGFMDEWSKWGEQTDRETDGEKQDEQLPGERVSQGDGMIMTWGWGGGWRVTGSSLSVHLLLWTCSLIDWVQTQWIQWLLVSTVYLWKTCKQLKGELSQCE